MENVDFQYFWALRLVAFLLTAKYVTLNDLERPFYVKLCFCAGIHLEFWRGFFESNCVKNNKGKPTLSAAKVFSVGSRFWRYKVYAGILGSSQICM